MRVSLELYHRNAYSYPQEVLAWIVTTEQEAALSQIVIVQPLMS